MGMPALDSSLAAVCVSYMAFVPTLSAVYDEMTIMIHELRGWL